MTFQHYRPKPTHPDMASLHAEALELAARARQTQRRPSRWRTLLRKLRSWRTVGSNWWINRARDRQGREDLLPLYFIWTTTRACNFLCSYCDDHQGKKYPELDNTKVLDTEGGLKLLKVLRTRTPSVYYAGGEPTMRQDLPELLSHASLLGYFPQTINTNGSLLHSRMTSPRWSNFLADLDVIVVSLDSLDTAKLSTMYRYSRPENVIRNILALRELKREYGFKLMVNCVIQPDSIDDALDVLDWANDLGITFTGVPQNEGPQALDRVLARPEYRRLVDRVLDRHDQGHGFAGSRVFNERLLTGGKLECRNTIKPHVDYDGGLFWPCKASVNVKPLKIPVLDFESIDEIWEYGTRRINPTRFQGCAPDQCGAACNWAQNYSTHSYLEGLRDPKLALREMTAYAKD